MFTRGNQKYQKIAEYLRERKDPCKENQLSAAIWQAPKLKNPRKFYSRGMLAAMNNGRNRVTDEPIVDDIKFA